MVAKKTKKFLIACLGLTLLSSVGNSIHANEKKKAASLILVAFGVTMLSAGFYGVCKFIKNEDENSRSMKAAEAIGIALLAGTSCMAGSRALYKSVA